MHVGGLMISTECLRGSRFLDDYSGTHTMIHWWKPHADPAAWPPRQHPPHRVRLLHVDLDSLDEIAMIPIVAQELLLESRVPLSTSFIYLNLTMTAQQLHDSHLVCATYLADSNYLQALLREGVPAFLSTALRRSPAVSTPPSCRSLQETCVFWSCMQRQHSTSIPSFSPGEPEYCLWDSFKTRHAHLPYAVYSVVGAMSLCIWVPSWAVPSSLFQNIVMSGERCIFCGSVGGLFWQTWGSYMPQPCQLEAIIGIYQAAGGHIHGLLAN